MKKAFSMMYLRKISFIFILSALAAPASAMTINEFLPKAEKLMNSGIGAMFSKHRKSVSAEMEKVTTGYRADIKKAQKAGKRTPSCPPKKASLNGKEFLAYLQAIPNNQRNMQVRTAFDGFMTKKYPC